MGARVATRCCTPVSILKKKKKILFRLTNPFSRTTALAFSQFLTERSTRYLPVG
jgi:hypothetical protein